MTVRPSRRALCLRFCGPAVLVLALGAYVAEFARWHGFLTQIDLMVHCYGGHRVLSGLDLYSRGIFNSPRILLFTYTPFAALCFTPLNLLTVPCVPGWRRAAVDVRRAPHVDRTARPPPPRGGGR